MNAEQALMYQLQKEAEATPSLGEAAGYGALGGAALGALGGTVPHMISRGIDRGRVGLETRFKGEDAGKIMQDKLMGRGRAGFRMAGGLMGALLGGALGAGMRQATLQESPAARILAKVQTSGELDDADRIALENILTDTYTDMSRG